MAPPQTRRSSGRRRAAVTTYTDDAFEATAVSRDEQNIGEPSATQRDIPEDSDEEFTLGAEEYTSNRDEEGKLDQVLSEAEIGSGEESGDEGESTPKPDRKDIGRSRDGTTRSRGIVKSGSHITKTMLMKFTFGVGSQELLSMAHARENWAGARDTTLPSRQSIKRSGSGPSYGPAATFSVARDLLERESSEGWDWYYSDAAGTAFRKQQRLEHIGEDVGQKYLHVNKDAEHTVLIGPIEGQKTYRLKCGEVFNFGDAWEDREHKTVPVKKKTKRCRKGGDSPFEESLADPSKRSDMPAQEQRNLREGWILNFGNKIQSLSWAPNCPCEQYLAVSVRVPHEQRDTASTTKRSTAPAFTPSPPYRAAIQIWSFESREVDGLRRPDMNVKPRLRLVLCSDSGDISHLCWCPMTRKRRLADEAENTFNVGLLAGIWGDGNVKVLDIALSKNADDAEWMRLETPAFQAKPASTLCTCIAWLSPSDIAVGCANGFVGIWSLSRADAGGQKRPQHEGNPPPYFYTQVQNTYVLSIATAYPSWPHIIATVDVDGQGRMMSLLDPVKDSVESQRLRLGSAGIVYSPFFRSFMSANDRGWIRLLPLRRFFTSVAAFKPDSAISVIAPSSPFHPCTLVGNEVGAVMASNPLRRLLGPKEKLWQQTWFSHEMVPGKAQAGATSNGGPLSLGGDGVSRFYDGFKAEQSIVSTTVAGVAVSSMTTFDEGTGATVLAWNQNRQCAGWASAGLGCGLVRVEDLSV